MVMHKLISKSVVVQRSVKRIIFISLLTLTALAMSSTQGCVHAQQTKELTDITVSQPERVSRQANHSSKPQVIGHFVVNTENYGAFLEGFEFKSLAAPNTLQQVRIKMAGDDEWLLPSEINIYLYPQQQHYFEIAAVIDNKSHKTQSTQNKINFALSNFRFLKSDATASINASTLTYSVAISSDDSRSPQQSRS
ncbi:hypothetical protein A9Q81_03730 [Gammaproteobacteria bacterium 42_54_T18]|nr:hypothetical protein A9Q81_03730 [Gammaproteobacteria bacterium 42_54_T18]